MNDMIYPPAGATVAGGADETYGWFGGRVVETGGNMDTLDLTRLGKGKTGRINPRDARYSIGQNPRYVVTICGWANEILVKMAQVNRCGKGEMMMRLIEKAADGATAAVIAVTLGLMAADKAGIW